MTEDIYPFERGDINVVVGGVGFKGKTQLREALTATLKRTPLGQSIEGPMRAVLEELYKLDRHCIKPDGSPKDFVPVHTFTRNRHPANKSRYEARSVQVITDTGGTMKMHLKQTIEGLWRAHNKGHPYNYVADGGGITCLQN